MKDCLDEINVDITLSNVVSDRGSNFVKCFRQMGVQPLYCFGHRLNNVLKKVFFQNETLNKRKQTPFLAAATTTTQPLLDDYDSSSEPELVDSCHESDDEMIPSKPVKKQKRKQNKKIKMETVIDHEKLKLGDLKHEEKAVVDQISNIKKVVAYVKRVC